MNFINVNKVKPRLAIEEDPRGLNNTICELLVIYHRFHSTYFRPSGFLHHA
jgi:hypothetical protein